MLTSDPAGSVNGAGPAPDGARPRRAGRIALAALVWALAAAFSFPLFASSPDESPALAELPVCDPRAVDLRGFGGAARFRVEIADTYESRARGLMHREHMERDSGMLFLFEPPRPVAFWMRNTILPLDLIFVDAVGKVIRVTENAVPFSEALMPSGGPVRAVLEVNAGEAARFGVAQGTELRHPGFGPGAAWPCP